MKGLKYSNPVPPSAYKCSKCGAFGVKLWRDHGDTDLFCAKCLVKESGVKVSDIDTEGNHLFEGGPTKTDTLGKYLPAVPFEAPDEIHFWKYATVPDAGCEWWKALPTTK